MKLKTKKLTAVILFWVMVIPLFRYPITVFADIEKYPYTMFASSKEEGAITVNSGNFCINGSVATGGTIVSNGNMNVNGTKIENVEEGMIYLFEKIDEVYFSTTNVECFAEDYSINEMNLNINSAYVCYGNVNLQGNVSLNGAVKAYSDINISGENINANNLVVMSKYGDVNISGGNVSMTGLIYAPFGEITVSAQNVNLNNVVIIAEKITLNGGNVNVNYNSSIAGMLGNVSELLYISYDEWKYMEDENINDIPDFLEDINNWSKLLDSDGEGLPDSFEDFFGSDSWVIDTDGDGLNDYFEVMMTYTNPATADTDGNGVSDSDEDLDGDGLNNLEEYTLGTEPQYNDTDSDGLSDGEEVNTYGTDPLKVDTDEDGLSDGDEVYIGTSPLSADSDGDGTLDCDEKTKQTFIHVVENEDCLVDEVILTMSATGNIRNTTTVESVMNKDIICSEVVGLAGEPFSIESESQFDSATISFRIDQSKLGETSFDSLMFLWYNEEDYEFVELETIYDYDNSIVSVETTHFSRYMLVDKNKWFDVWNQSINYTGMTDEQAVCNTILAVDCSGSMADNDATSYDSVNGVNICNRYAAALSFIDFMGENDKIGVVTFNSTATQACGLTSDTAVLKKAVLGFKSNGGTSFNEALKKSITMLSNSGDVQKKIILLTDGESDVSLTVLAKAKKAGIKIYTIGLGDSSDSVLKEIADYTVGEFFKAFSSEELEKIYQEIGVGNDFNKTDSDNDGLYDIVETTGIRIQNGNTIYGCNPEEKDTDKDGLTDGAEIDPEIRWKWAKNYPSSVPEIIREKQYYFVMKSDPVLDSDTDGDGYDDISDTEPIKYNDYSFLDNEIHNIQYMNDAVSGYSYVEVRSDGVATPYVSIGSYENTDLQDFRFVWCEQGYKIYSVAREDDNMVLTVDIDNDSYRVILAPDENKPEQIWEVLPGKNDYGQGNSGTGLVLRSKALNYSEEVGKPLYMTYVYDQMMASSNLGEDEEVVIRSSTNWIRFGEMTLNYNGWENTGNSYSEEIINKYMENREIGLSDENIEMYHGKSMLLFQGGGSFPALKYGEYFMDYNGCGIIGAYNALVLAGEEVDFFKLALEIEMHAINSKIGVGDNFLPGKLGTDITKLGLCLNAYGLSYTTYSVDDYDNYTEACEAYDAALAEGKVGLLSYNWNWLDSSDAENFQFINDWFGMDVYLAEHVIAVEYNLSMLSNPLVIFNEGNYVDTYMRYGTLKEAFEAGSDSVTRFKYGYIIDMEG